MKEKIKKIIFGYLPGFILGIISACTISVIAATYFPSNQTTYDNTNTELQSENVQDAIDELYGVCFPKSAGDTILDNTDIVTSGDGLYEDEYEDGRYFYRGKNVDNWITFNGENAGWRIISIEPDKTIKIMKWIGIEDIVWDSDGSNNWLTASMQTYLNETYYNSLSSIAQSQIVAKDFSIGAVEINNNFQNTINEELANKWNGKIALPTVSEFIRTMSRKNCTTQDIYISTYCGETSWLPNSYWWTLSPASGTNNYVLAGNRGNIINTTVNTIDHYTTYPTIYLSSDIKIISGTGTQSDPYVVNS